MNEEAPSDALAHTAFEASSVDVGIAWEAEGLGFFSRFFATVWSATTAPIATFSGLAKPGSLWAALRFTFLASLVGWLPMWLILPCLAALPMFVGMIAMASPEAGDLLGRFGAGMLCASVASIPVFLLLFSLYVELCYGAVFFLLARLAGGTGGLFPSLRDALHRRDSHLALRPALRHVDPPRRHVASLGLTLADARLEWLCGLRRGEGRSRAHA